VLPALGLSVPGVLDNPPHESKLWPALCCQTDQALNGALGVVALQISVNPGWGIPVKVLGKCCPVILT